MLLTALAAIARSGLGGQPGHAAHAPYADADWPRLLDSIHEQRLAGLAVQAAERNELILTEAQWGELEVLHRSGLISALQLESFAGYLIQTLGSAGIDALVLKGPAAAALDYEDPALRLFGDVDLLVPSAQFDAAVEVLEADGGRRRFSEPRRNFTARFGKGVCVVAANGFEIDVHRSFAAGAFAMTVQEHLLWRDPAEFSIGTQRVRALDRPHRALHAAAHAVLGQRRVRYVPLRDLAEILLHPHSELQALVALAHEHRLDAVLARAILQANVALELDPVLPGTRWAMAFEPSRRDQLVLRAYTAPARSYAAQVRSGVWVAPGLAAKARYVSALALPNRRYLADRDASYVRRLRRAMRVGR